MSCEVAKWATKKCLIFSIFSTLDLSSSASRPLASSSSFTPAIKRPLLSLRSTGSRGAGDVAFSGAPVPLGLTSLGMDFSAAFAAVLLAGGWGVAAFTDSLGAAAGAGEGPVRAAWPAFCFCC